VRAIAVTWHAEPHCDHEAAAMLAETVAQRLHAQLFEYLVWGWTFPEIDQAVRRYKSYAIDVAAGRPRQRRAIAAHRSQLGSRIAGAGQAFRLPRHMVRLVDRPQLILLSRRI
jgi:LmbE family N-acetylglucosaminyl deacetylase